MTHEHRYRCAAAWIDGEVSGPLDISIADGLIVALQPVGAPAGRDTAVQDDVTETLPGLVFPGFADAHSHLFHRALRGRTHAVASTGGSFWSWRESMYALAARLDPDRLQRLAVAVYAELVCAGYTAVGEFHYLHHGPGGRPYDDPNAMGLAIAAAGKETGIGVTLLDAAYLAGGFDQPLSEVQQRFSDGTIGSWAERVAALPGTVRTGVAVHSVRAVPTRDLPAVMAAAAGRPLHVHLSEQIAENAACLTATGLTPTALLDRAGVLGPRTSAVHAIHLAADDIRRLADAGVTAVICPTTEADLADGLPAVGRLAAAGVPLACGGDQQVCVDPFAQARGLEYAERVSTGRRGTLPPAELVRAATVSSHRSIDSPAGRIVLGAPADLVAVRTDSARTAGSDPAQLVMSASAADVAVVVIGGDVVARDGMHQRLGDPGALLSDAVVGAWR